MVRSRNGTDRAFGTMKFKSLCGLLWPGTATLRRRGMRVAIGKCRSYGAWILGFYLATNMAHLRCL